MTIAIQKRPAKPQSSSCLRSETIANGRVIPFDKSEFTEKFLRCSLITFIYIIYDQSTVVTIIHK